MIACKSVRSMRAAIRGSRTLSILQPTSKVPIRSATVVAHKKPKQNNDSVVDHQEHCKSGLDSEISQLDKTCYGKEKTSPDELHEHAKQESKKVCSAVRRLCW